VGRLGHSLRARSNSSQDRRRGNHGLKTARTVLHATRSPRLDPLAQALDVAIEHALDTLPKERSEQQDETGQRGLVGQRELRSASYPFCTNTSVVLFTSATKAFEAGRATEDCPSIDLLPPPRSQRRLRTCRFATRANGPGSTAFSRYIGVGTGCSRRGTAASVAGRRSVGRSRWCMGSS
jgi:hypothetical protein